MSNKKKQMVMPRKMREVIAMFDLFMGYYALGLACFMGEEPLPCREDLALMITYAKRGNDDAGRVDGGERIPYAQTMLEKAETVEGLIEYFGGLEVFRQSFSFFAKLENEACAKSSGRINRYDLLRDLSSVGGNRFPSVGSVSFQYHISSRNMQEKKTSALHQIARDIYYKRLGNGSKK